MLFFPLVLLLLPTASGGHADCVACHGDHGKTHKASVHSALACTDCHEAFGEPPHRKGPKPACGSCHGDAAKEVARSLHGGLGAEACVACHGGAHVVKPPGRPPGEECRSCHGDAVREHAQSVHARPDSHGEGATCASCHGPAHRMLAAQDPASTISRARLPETCGACHANPELLARHRIPFARPVEAYRLSVHGRAVARGEKAASCSDCHANHAIFPGRDARSKINHWRVPETCGTCHADILKAYVASVHGSAVRHGASGAPVCTDCHGEHTILAPSEPRSLVNPARVSSATCERCHADERLAERYSLPQDRVPAFEGSYHGLALRSGRQTVANCASCHGVHNILPSTDPLANTHPTNLARTCGKCHSGAGRRFAIGPVHVRPAGRTEHPAVKGIRVAYWFLIPLTLGFMLLHNGLDFLSKLVRPPARPQNGDTVERMGLHFRIAHGLVVLSFPVLVVTGFALKFPEAFWAAPLLRWESSFALRGTLHRVAAVVLVAGFAYHGIHLVVSRRHRRILHYLALRVRDLRDLLGTLRYGLGRASRKPTYSLFSYAEKIEYWAFVWGTVVMTVSGALLWFNSFSLRHFPNWVADAATALHYYEAILATLSILVWHLYFVVFDPDVYPMDRAWITGKAPGSHLRHARPGAFRLLSRAPCGQDPPAGAESPGGGPRGTEADKGPPRAGPGEKGRS